MPEDVFYHDLIARDRLVHIVDADLPTCETLSVVFRLEGFHTAFSINLQGFFTQAERRRPERRRGWLWRRPAERRDRGQRLQRDGRADASGRGR